MPFIHVESLQNLDPSANINVVVIPYSLFKICLYYQEFLATMQSLNSTFPIQYINLYSMNLTIPFRIIHHPQIKDSGFVRAITIFDQDYSGW